MPRRTRLAAASWLLLAALFVPALAGAQTTTTTSTASVTAGDQVDPDRFVGGVLQGTRPQNLNPLGVSYSDCTSDMTLRFHVVVQGFDGSENMQVWATKSGDCSATTERGINTAAASCWLVNGGFTAQPYSSLTGLEFDVRVQDLVGPENLELAPNTGYVRYGASVCDTAQTSFVAVPLDIFFIPLDSVGNSLGSSYDYKIAADLVGPPAPVDVNEQVGNTLFIANWTANTDTDTAGYDLFIDPIPGQEEAGATTGTTTEVICPDATTTTTTTTTTTGDDGGDAADGSGDITDAASDALVDVNSGSAGATSSIADACMTVTVGGTNTTSPGITCLSTLITSAKTSDAGIVSTEVFDEAGDLLDGSIESVSGGISTAPCANIVGAGCSTNVTVSDKAVGTYTITGLKNGTTYNVTVAAVDGFGNIGPPSLEVCDFPAPVNDFWTLYGQDGGKAGGGLCALEAVGKPVPSTVGVTMLVGIGAIFARRRRARRNDSVTRGDNVS